MAYPTVDAPYGLQAINRVDGLPYAGAVRQIPIASTYNTAIFNGETVKTKGVELEIEHVDGHFYAYAKINNQFIAQGETLEKLLETAHKRFPGKVFFGDLPEEEHQKS